MPDTQNSIDTDAALMKLFKAARRSGMDPKSLGDAFGVIFEALNLEVFKQGSTKDESNGRLDCRFGEDPTMQRQNAQVDLNKNITKLAENIAAMPKPSARRFLVEVVDEKDALHGTEEQTLDAGIAITGQWDYRLDRRHAFSVRELPPMPSMEDLVEKFIAADDQIPLPMTAQSIGRRLSVVLSALGMEVTK